MVRGRRIGTIKVSIDEIKIIMDMSLSKNPIYTRTEIAKRINRAKSTILRYQKYYGLL